MSRSNDRKDSLALRAAYARKRDWTEKLAVAEKAGDEAAAREAAKFVAEYEGLIADLANQSSVS